MGISFIQEIGELIFYEADETDNQINSVLENSGAISAS